MNDRKEEHLSLLADAFMNSLAYHDNNVTGGDPYVDVMGVLGMDKNNAVERAYAKNLYDVALVPYLKSEWARMRNLGDL